MVLATCLEQAKATMKKRNFIIELNSTFIRKQSSSSDA